MRARWVLVVSLLAVTVGGSQALAAGGPSVSLSTTAPKVAGYHATDYTRSFVLKGVLHATPAGGASIAVQAQPWPFHAPFQTIGTATTGAGGGFTFSATLSRATRYRVSGGGATSRVLTVYAFEHELSYHCNICGSRAGFTTVHVTGSYETPPGLVAEHAARPFYAYLSVIPGTVAPSRLALRKTVKQHIVQPDTVTYAYTIHISPPAATWTWRTDGCFRDHERADGFGLPGHHQCGNPSVKIGRNTYLG